MQVDSFAPAHSAFGFPIYVAPLPAGSIQRVCHDTLPWLISFSLGIKGGHIIMTKIKSFTVGLPVTELKRAVEWYRQLLGEVEEVNPAPGVWEFQIVPSGWLQLFESEIIEP